MKAATHKNQLDDDSTIYHEAFEHMLEAWVSVLHESDTFPAGFTQNSGVEVFNTYLQVSAVHHNRYIEVILNIVFT